jgi:hypothetical protein
MGQAEVKSGERVVGLDADSVAAGKATARTVAASA